MNFAPLLMAFLAGASADFGVYDEFRGVRSLAMGGAQRGLGTSNDTLYFNPAGMALTKRYGIDFQYGYSPFDKLTHYNFSAVDSKSGPVAGAMGYTFDRGDKNNETLLHRITLGTAYAIGEGISLGVATKNVRGTYLKNGAKKNISLYTGDLGLSLALAQGFALGAAYHNVIKTEEPKLVPPTASGGLAFNYGPLTLVADLLVNLRRSQHRTTSYHAGAEFFVADMFPLRVGFQRLPYVITGKNKFENRLSAGVGWITSSGGIDVSYEQSLQRDKLWQLVSALKFFL